jgi:hypothetical protein
MKSLLVGMLSCGENEREQSLASLQAQRFRDWDLFTLDNLPNKAAHDRLYATFMSRAGDYRWFFKLDADMVLAGEDALGTLIGLLDHPRRDWLMVDVLDWASDTVGPGAQAFSSRVRWQANPDPLLVDHAPTFGGEAVRLWQQPPFILHSPDPSRYQAFRYGVHRALKAVQLDRNAKDVGRAATHWSLLKNVWRAYRAKGDERRLLVLLGAEAVLGDEYEVETLMEAYAGDYTRELFDILEREGAAASFARHRPYWDHEQMNDLRWAERFNDRSRAAS